MSSIVPPLIGIIMGVPEKICLSKLAISMFESDILTNSESFDLTFFWNHSSWKHNQDLIRIWRILGNDFLNQSFYGRIFACVQYIPSKYQLYYHISDDMIIINHDKYKIDLTINYINSPKIDSHMQIITNILTLLNESNCNN
jgi:hypothetical protein